MQLDLCILFDLTKSPDRTIKNPPRCLVLLLAGSLLCPAASSTASEFNGKGICQFKLIRYVLPGPTEDAINTAVKKSLSQHRKVFGFKVRPNFKVRMRIFGHYEDYEAFTLQNRESRYIAQHVGSVTNLSGYYSSRTGEIVTWRQEQPGHLANNILHEASHAIMLAHHRRVPIWINEGCATYFSYPPDLQDDFDVGSLKYRWAKLNIWLREGQLPPVANFVNLSPEAWRQQEIHQAYTVSWSLFQYLMSTPANQRILRQLVQALQQERGREMHCAALIARFYPGGTSRFEQNWHDWITQGGKRILGPDIEDILEQIKRRS